MDDLLASCLDELDHADQAADFDLPDEDIASLMKILHGDSSTDTSPETKKRRNRKRAAHELVYLRDQVVEYTRRLEGLQATTVPPTAESLVWQERSLRQACERKAAEEENLALKDLLQRQVKVAESLMKIVSKRPRLAEMTYLDKWRQSTKLVIDPVLRADMFHSLMDAKHARLESVFIANRLLDSIATDCIQKTDVSYDEHTRDIVFDLIVTDVADIDYMQCAQALWEMYSGASYETELEVVQPLESFGENAVQIEMLLKVKKYNLVVHQHLGCKRYFEPNRVVMVFDSILDDEGHPYPSGVYVARESSWLTITNEGDNKCSLKYFSHGNLPCKSTGIGGEERQDEIHTMAFAEHMMDCYKRSIDLLGLYLHGQLDLTLREPVKGLVIASNDRVASE